MTGKILTIVLILTAVIGGAAMYYLQVYAFYNEVTPTPGQDVILVPVDGGAPQAIPYSGFQAIDADSSPIRYRACFQTDLTIEAARATFIEMPDQSPRTAPGWFDCFDAEALGGELEAGTATTFLSHKNIEYGVDRIVALTSDGRGYAWHELNNCGEKAYDGTVVGEECPPLPQR
ncbi:DUF6446 family protein [Aliisedimentitalea scapharcae]|uniref:DUF6446 family protein n=1 Tax=Aliisedimentitalea scapharcae TaxID=1524259 RepID=A0ABZ2XYL7_9RHOB